MDLGEDIAAYLEHSPLPLPPLPPATDDNPMSQTEDKGPPPPTPEQISEIRDSIPSNWWPAYDDFEQYDVIMGAVEMNDWQQQLTEAATNLGMPPIQSPFVQVVLVTDAALQKLSYVGENALDPGLTKKQPAVDAAFKLLKPSQGAAPQSRGFSFKP
ncbi:hypothetical protein C8R46DRAFT_1189290 [Mycena filopes]|nr:hypothetical protein C8R46DRAFT_1189290 [Mycena filopes]